MAENKQKFSLLKKTFSKSGKYFEEVARKLAVSVKKSLKTRRTPIENPNPLPDEGSLYNIIISKGWILCVIKCSNTNA